ncbi:hypothetical protein J6590_006388 [Homalodisca vitripennis]|nr:hypothetical protein J6590_006388 [Homalodisca vitripennis]
MRIRWLSCRRSFATLVVLICLFAALSLLRFGGSGTTPTISLSQSQIQDLIRQAEISNAERLLRIQTVCRKYNLGLYRDTSAHAYILGLYITRQAEISNAERLLRIQTVCRKYNLGLYRDTSAHTYILGLYITREAEISNAERMLRIQTVCRKYNLGLIQTVCRKYNLGLYRDTSAHAYTLGLYITRQAEISNAERLLRIQTVCRKYNLGLYRDTSAHTYVLGIHYSYVLNTSYRSTWKKVYMLQRQAEISNAERMLRIQTVCRKYNLGLYRDTSAHAYILGLYITVMY